MFLDIHFVVLWSIFFFEKEFQFGCKGDFIELLSTNSMRIDVFFFFINTHPRQLRSEKLDNQFI